MILFIKRIYKALTPVIIQKYISTHITKSSYVNKFQLYIDEKLLFIHIPKAAGVSVHKTLFGIDSPGHHLTASIHKSRFSEKEWDQTFKFTFVRNPYSRLYSAYNYLSQGGRRRDLDKEYQCKLNTYESFDAFVINGLEKAVNEKIQHFTPQFEMITDSNGVLMVDFIGKYETLEIDFRIIQHLSKRKIIRNLKQENFATTPKEHFTFSPQMINIVQKVYQKDFELFGYPLTP